MRSVFSLTAVAAAFLLLGCSKLPEYKAPPQDGKHISISIKSLKDAEPEFFTVKVEGKKINFFVVKILDRVESYFDACEKCYVYGKGYRHDSFSVTCRYCNVRYRVDSLKDGVGSCHPIPLKGERKGNKYIIATEDIKKGKKYFR